jgi:signal transduction histidine kinase
MITAMHTENEAERLKSLESFSILDTLPEEEYDNITAIAAEICGTHISLVSLLDDQRQWFKSHHGLDATETPKEQAFCAHAIQNPKQVFVVPDARLDERFHDNPLVTDHPHVIFYAGVPLVTEEGTALGTLCVIDKTPKLLSPTQIKSLQSLAKQVMKLLELRRKTMQVEEMVTVLEKKNKELEQFAFVAAHDLRSPLNIISGLTKLYRVKHADSIDSSAEEILDSIESSSSKLKSMVDGLLQYYRAEKVAAEHRTMVPVSQLLSELESLFGADDSSRITLDSNLERIEVNRTAVDQVLINLIANAIKYNDKPVAEVEIGISESEDYYEFQVKDNGPGIAPEHQEEIFEIFKVVSKADKNGRSGDGIGLATVKKMIEAQNGKIWVRSSNGEGATFSFTFSK